MCWSMLSIDRGYWARARPGGEGIRLPQFRSKVKLTGGGNEGAGLDASPTRYLDPHWVGCGSCMDGSPKGDLRQCPGLGCRD
ncbi:hypothetical protein U1Q18_008058 [Sarracenia purpurea var. burkii]